MKKCTNCGIIVHENFDSCPNCKGDSFEQVMDGATKRVNKEGLVLSKSMVFCLIEIIGGVLSMVGIFLPFIRVSFLGTVLERTFYDLAPFDYVIFIILAGAGMVLGLVRLHAITAVLGAIYEVLFYLETYEYFGNINSSEFGALAVKGIGFYCMVGGSMLMIIFGVISQIVKAKK